MSGWGDLPTRSSEERERASAPPEAPESLMGEKAGILRRTRLDTSNTSRSLRPGDVLEAP